MDKTERPTIKDIARMLHVSTSTVSRALNNHPEVSEKTKKAVLRLVKELNYHPNTIAISLVKNQTKTLGVIIPDVTQPFYASAISGIEEIALKNGYYVLICQSDESCKKEIELVKTLYGNRVDGLIICTATTTGNYQHISDITKSKIPLVLFDRDIESINADKVVSDDHHGAYKVVEHLIKSGNRKIAHIAGPRQLSVTKNRLQGYLQALHHHHLPVNDKFIIHCNLTQRDMRTCAACLLELADAPDAIFTINDPTAIQTIYVAKQKNLRIPEDIAVAGFDNQELTPYLDPPLTTVAQPSFKMGQEAARLIFSQIHHQEPGYTMQTKTFKTKLIIRKSSRV